MAKSFKTWYEPSFTLCLPLCKETSYGGKPFELQDPKTQVESSVFEGLE